MNSDYKDNRTVKSGGVLQSFQYAISGIIHAVRNERNLRVHFSVSIFVVIMGLLLKISVMEWLFVLFAIGGVITLELMNTALERIVDLVTDEFHPLAKQAKDVSAGAVFIYSMLSVIVGLIIFLPRILRFLTAE